ncbi:MAG TPA: ABC transporter substrate-binding protein [Thermoanaerobaculia bacterium]|nr:ABC transporter substrate-binding protein [Thermoanaerobaculia bacterium]
MRTAGFRTPPRLLPAALAGCALVGAALAAAGGRPREDAAAEAPARQGPERPVRGGTAVIGSNADISGVNELVVPATLPTDEVLFRIFQHLVEEQGDFDERPPTFEPQLAEAWEFSPDRKTLTFRLRRGAVWSDGVPITAEDVRWTWQAQTHPDVGWTDASAKERITDVQVLDPHTVRFHFREAYGKQLLDANEGVILPKHAWSALPFAEWPKSADWFREHLVTSGPFLLASWKPQQELVLARNPRYYDPRLPYLDRVVLRVVPEQSALLTMLRNGEVDFLSGNVSPADVPAVRADPDLQLIAYWFKLTVFVAWNNEDPRFADREVRRALTMAIDRQTIVDSLWGELARVGSSPILANIWAHHPRLRPLPYDPQEARRILAARGWRDTNGDGLLDRGGQPFAFELTTNTGNQQRADATVMIQEQLRRVGIQAEPRVLEFHTLVEQLDDGTFDAMVTGIGLDTSLDFTSFLHSRSVGDGNNFPRYRNPEMDLLLEEIQRAPDILQARGKLHRLQEIVARDQPVSFLWESQRIHGANRRLRDVQSNILFSLFDLEEWWMAPAR